MTDGVRINEVERLMLLSMVTETQPLAVLTLLQLEKHTIAIIKGKQIAYLRQTVPRKAPDAESPALRVQLTLPSPSKFLTVS